MHCISESLKPHRSYFMTQLLQFPFSKLHIKNELPAVQNTANQYIAAIELKKPGLYFVKNHLKLLDQIPCSSPLSLLFPDGTKEAETIHNALWGRKRSWLLCIPPCNSSCSSSQRACDALGLSPAVR